jgi:hypothetical protein
MRPALLILAAAVTICNSAAAEGDIQSCQSNGKVTFTNFPCKELPSREAPLVQRGTSPAEKQPEVLDPKRQEQVRLDEMFKLMSEKKEVKSK